MDNDILGKIGRGFWNDGIFGAVKAALGVDGQTAPSIPAADDPDVRRLVIDDSGIKGFDFEDFDQDDIEDDDIKEIRKRAWRERLREVQPITMARERPTLRDLASDLVSLDLLEGDYDELKKIVDIIVRNLGAESPLMVLVDMRMTVRAGGDEPVIGFVLTAEGAGILRAVATYAMGCEMAGRPLFLDAFELDFMPRKDRIKALYQFSLALPAGGGRFFARGSGFAGLCMVWAAIARHVRCRDSGPLAEYSLGDLRTFRHFSPFSPLLATFSPLDLFISRDRAQMTLLHELAMGLTDLLSGYFEGEGKAVWDRWRRRSLVVDGVDVQHTYVIDTDALPAPLEPWRKTIVDVAEKVKAKRNPTLMDLTEAILAKMGEEESKQWFMVALDLLRYLMIDKEQNLFTLEAQKSVNVYLTSSEFL